MINKPYFYFITIMVFFVLYQGVSLAQEFPCNSRDSVMFFTLSLMRDRDTAMRTAMEYKSRKPSGVVPVKAKPKQETTKKPGQKFSLPPAHYYLNSGLSYSDNIYSTDEKRKGDINVSLTPGVRMNFVGRSRSVNVDMHLNTGNSIYHPDGNAQSGTVDLSTNLNFGRYLVSFSNTYFTNYVSTPGLGIETEKLEYYWSDTISSMISRHFNRIGFDLGYIRAAYSYEQDYRFSSRYDETVNFNQYLHIGSKTQLSTGYSHVRSMPTHEASYSEAYNNNSYNLSLAGALSSKVTGSVRMDYDLHDGKEGDDYRDTGIQGILGCSASKRTNFNLSLGSMTHEPSTKSDSYIKKSFSFEMNRRLAYNPKMNLSFTWSTDYTDYPKVEYDPNPKEEVVSSLGLGLAYAFRNWWDFSLALSHGVHKSNIGTDYNVNTITFGSQARF